MNKFFKSFIISLMVGIPITLCICFILYMKSDINQSDTIPDTPVLMDNLPETTDEVSSFEPENTPDSSDSVTLSFAGDVHFSELIIQKYDNSGISAIIDEEMLSHMENADLMILNHEFVFSTRGEAMEDKEYTLRNDPKYVKILQELGADVVSIANNHVLDFGKDAFLDTLETLENANIAYAGGGRNIQEASKPVVREINGQTFAIFAATRVSPSADWYAGKKHPGVFQTYDAAALNDAITDADTKSDYVIVFVHWGIERAEIPEEYQRTLAKGYIDAGADLIIGAHPHILQGFEYYKNVPICYSLGNYLFGNRTDETILLNVTFDKNENLSIKLIPCKRIDGILTKIQEPSKLFNHLTDISFDAAVSHGGILIQ